MEGGTRTLTGGFDTMVTGWSPEMEGLGARDGRRREPAGFFAISKAVVVDLVSGRSDPGLENGPGQPLTKRTLWW